MKRLSRDAIKMRLLVALSVRKSYEQRALGLLTEAAREAFVEELLGRIMGPPESEAIIIEPSNAGPFHSPYRGRWGEDEPHPFPDMPLAPH